MTNINKMYTDLDPTFSKAWDLDIKKTAGARAVRNSLILIITTRKGTRPFDPNFGCDLNRALFENINPLTVDTMSKNIREAIRNYEPRVQRLTVEVTPVYDSNEVVVSVYFSIVDNPDDLEQLKMRLSE